MSHDLAQLEVDHVLIAVGDLALGAREMETRYGLASVEGGRHAGWGTANRIVPLGETYLELVGVVDPPEAAESAFGRWVALGAGSGSGHLLGWAVRTQQLDALAVRLGLSVRTGSRVSSGGELLRWRSAGIEEAIAEPSLPFFIEWSPETSFPGSRPLPRTQSVEIARLELAGDATRLSAWLGKNELPVTIRRGAPAVLSIVLSGLTGDIVLGAGSS